MDTYILFFLYIDVVGVGSTFMVKYMYTIEEVCIANIRIFVGKTTNEAVCTLCRQENNKTKCYKISRIYQQNNGNVVSFSTLYAIYYMCVSYI